MNPDVPNGLYMVVGGRSETSLQLNAFSLVVTERADTAGLPFEQAQIIRICESPISPAEIGARLSVPLGAVTILLTDLVDQGRISLRAADSPIPVSPADDRRILERLHAGLLNLAV